MELHHIKPTAKGGADTYDNCIPLCFDCHADVKAYNPDHPKGRRYTESELRGHRDRWYKKIEESRGVAANPDYIHLDRQLLQQLRGILPSTGSIAFVRDHDYSQPYESSIHDDLREFIEHCKRPEFEFLDADLDGLKADLAARGKEFLVTLGRYVSSDPRPAFIGREGHWYSIPKYFGSDREGKENEKFVQEFREVNDLAAEVWKTYDALVRLARRKLAV